MEEARFIYQNRLDKRFYDASTGAMRGGPDKVIVYVNGVLCAMDRQGKVVIPVSRWELMAIGTACFLAAFKAKSAAPSSLEAAPPPTPPEVVDEHHLRSHDDERASPEARELRSRMGASYSGNAQSVSITQFPRTGSAWHLADETRRQNPSHECR